MIGLTRYELARFFLRSLVRVWCDALGGWLDAPQNHSHNRAAPLVTSLGQRLLFGCMNCRRVTP